MVALFRSRSNARGLGTFVCYPGAEKTYMCRLLLLSQGDHDLTRLLQDDVRTWWLLQTVLVTSFNGITAASSKDMEPAQYDPKVPCMVRVLQSEMMQTQNQGPDFSVFRAAVLELLDDGSLGVRSLLLLVRYVQQTLCPPKPTSPTSFVGVLLTDELVQLSILPPLSPTRRTRRRHKNCTSSSSSGSSHEDDLLLTTGHRPTPAATSSARFLGADDPMMDAQGAVVVGQGADAASRAVCDIARSHRLRPCITSLSGRFVKHQAAISGSAPVRIGAFKLVDAERVTQAVRRMLISCDKGLQVTIRSDVVSVLPAEVVTVCLGVLAGGHARAAQILIEAIKTSRDGQTYLGRVLDMLQADQLSLAEVIINFPYARPIVVAVSLMGYEMHPNETLCDDIKWDYVYSEGR